MEKDDENTDQLIMDTCREGMGIELNLQDINRSHRIGMKTQREVPPEPEENGQVKHQKVRPIIVKFTSYRRRQQVFSAKKNLKGKHVGISENLTKIRQKIFNLARDVVGYKNVWSQDGKIFAKRHDDRIITMTKERDLYLIEGRMDPATLNTIISHIINYRYAQLRVFSKLCRIFVFFSCCGVLKTSVET